MRSHLLFVLLAGCTRPIPASSSADAPASPPLARTVDVVDEAFGMQIADPYRWMEDPAHADELQAWLLAQGAYSRTALDALPGRSALHAELLELLGASARDERMQVRGEQLFYLHTEPGGGSASLWVKHEDRRRQVFDPASLAPERVLLDFTASPDGRLAVLQLAEGGSEITTLHVVDTQTGALDPLAIPNVWGEITAQWLPDGAGFVYTQLDADAVADPDKELFQGMVVRRHLLEGEDIALIGPETGGPPAIVASPFPKIHIPAGSTWAVALGWSARAELEVAVARIEELSESPVPWRHVAHLEDGVIDVEVDGDELYLLVTQRSPHGEVLRVSAESPSLDVAPLIPAGPRIIEDLAVAADGVYLADSLDGDSGLARFADGALSRVDVPESRMLRLVHADPRTEGVWLWSSGYDQPRRYFAVDGSGAWSDTGVAHTGTADFSDAVVTRTTATSADGTTVPMTLVHRRDLARDGQRPTLLRAYASYGMTLTPYYQPDLRAWLDRDGVYAVCHARGGGARGPAWHAAGQGPNKPAAVADFAACAQHLAEQGYTDAAHTGAWAASMGGVLVGGALARSPERFAGVFLEVPVLNPLRHLEAQNGPNQTAELGATPDSAEGVAVLAALDPYVQLDADGQYPATLVALGLEDQRVEAWMSAKFPARLQATATREPVWVRVAAGEGHGVGASSDQRAALLADGWSFLLSAMDAP
ncbi:MAG: S9 family peptidase [Deltaproteobacteria bacterium]|nr:MAG: S9 family peptidase [Deltaproteobacteria bacterium]